MCAEVLQLKLGRSQFTNYVAVYHASYVYLCK